MAALRIFLKESCVSRAVENRLSLSGMALNSTSASNPSFLLLRSDASIIQRSTAVTGFQIAEATNSYLLNFMLRSPYSLVLLHK